jgi:hypothetical protein
MNESQDRAAISFEVTYTLESETGNIITTSSAKATLDDSSIMIDPLSGADLTISYTDIMGILDEDYKVKLFLSSKNKVTLSQIGYEYENFLITLYRLKNELYLKYLLMNEGLRAKQIEASFTFSSYGEDVFQGLCEVRLYDSALLVLPQKNKPLRIPYCYINSVREENFSIIVESESGEKLTFTQLGEKRDFLQRSLSEAMNALSINTQKMIGEVQPQLDTTRKRRLADLLKDGIAAEKVEIEKVAPEFWSLLEAKARTKGLTESYDFLKELSQRDKICLGVKQNLSNKETEEYVWFLIPLYGDDPNVPGNAVALEATTGTDEGRATYFFRIQGRQEYADKMGLSILHKNYDEFLRTINRCMIEINFRREPIYFTTDQLNNPKYIHYKFATQEIPSLQKLRSHFIGRVVHYNLDQWKTDVQALLRFNIEEKNDDTKWEKNAD